MKNKKIVISLLSIALLLICFSLLSFGDNNKKEDDISEEYDVIEDKNVTLVKEQCDGSMSEEYEIGEDRDIALVKEEERDILIPEDGNAVEEYKEYKVIEGKDVTLVKEQCN